MDDADRLTVFESATLNQRIVNALYLEAMVLADEARAYFDGSGHRDRDDLTPLQRVSFSCESLKVTTRLMHAIAWLLIERTAAAVDPAVSGRSPRATRLGVASATDGATICDLPEEARKLIEASTSLYQRVKRIDRDRDREAGHENAARLLQRSVALAF